jgi:hypothetical protein
MTKRATVYVEQASPEPGITLDELGELTPDSLAAKQHEARERIQKAKRDEAREQAVGEHDAAAKAAAPDLDVMAAAFADDRDRFQAAATKAVDAIVEVLDLATKNDTRVGDTVTALRGKGLLCSYVDADRATDFSTGAQPDGRGLLLHGEAWVRFEPVVTAYRVLAHALAARFGEHAPAVKELHLGRGVRDLERRARSLLGT